MKVRELLSDPSRWTQGTFARNRNGIPTSSNAPDACKWCLLGAIRKCYPEEGDYGKSWRKLKDAVYEYTGTDLAAVFNDTAKHEDILKVLEIADV